MGCRPHCGSGVGTPQCSASEGTTKPETREPSLAAAARTFSNMKWPAVSTQKFKEAIEYQLTTL